MEPRVVERPGRRLRARRGRFLLAALTVSLAPLVGASDGPQRALWMSDATLESADAIRRTIASAAAHGYSAVVAPLSLTPEPSPAGFDGMAETLKEAATRQLHVFAWLDVVRAAGVGELPAARDHVLYRHPEWLMVPRELAVEMLRVDLRSPEYAGRLSRWTRANAARVNGVYVSPLHPDAIAYLAERVSSVLSRYRVDGVHLGAVRFPGIDFDYGRRALDLFREDVRRGLGAAERVRMDRIEAIDPFAYPEEFPEQWRRFRHTRLTALVTRLRSAIHAAHPGAIVSAGVTLEADLALRDHLQDWRAWMENRLIDAVARLDETSGAMVFSYDTLLRPLAPALTTGRVTAAAGAP